MVELTDDIAAVEQLRTELGIPVDPRPDPARELRFPEISQELAEELLIDRDWLQRQADLLWDRKHLILYGPPGTGKTFLARKIAGHLAEPSAVKLVRFHPSYTYEDFFEGFRPVQRGDGQLVLAGYLPAQLDDAELGRLVAEAVAEVATALGERPGPHQMGQVMKAATAKTSGSAEGSRVTAAVRTALTG